MKYTDFRNTLSSKEPNEEWPPTLQALWYDAKEDWHNAHDLVDGSDAVNADWVHAYLHRKEGDDWNAGYWYRQAGKTFPKTTLKEEHREIVEFILLKK